MTKEQGGCHCGAVRIEVNTKNKKVVDCNCSICTKKGVLNWMVEPEQVSFLKGRADLQKYRFNTKKATHFFCGNCGIYVFTHPRRAPEKMSVNLRIMDNFEKLIKEFEIVKFDGQNYEAAVALLEAKQGGK